MSKQRFGLVIGLIFVLACAIRIVCFVGLIGSDDLSYSRGAYLLATGQPLDVSQHFQNRIGMILPVALAYKLFGVNEVSAVLWSFLYFMANFAVVVILATRGFDRWVGVIAALLYTFLPLEMFHATMLLSDLPASACLAVSGALLYLAGVLPLENSAPSLPACRVRDGVWLLIGGMALGWSYLIRETAAFFVIFAALYMGAWILRHKRLPWRWVWYWLGALAMLIFEAGFFLWRSGNPWQRYHTVAAVENVAGAMEFTKRYFYGMTMPDYVVFDRLRVLFDVREFGFYYFFILAGSIFWLITRRPRGGYFVGWLTTVFCGFSFSSVSLVEYMPLRSVPRYFLAFSVPGVIILAWFLNEQRHFFAASAAYPKRAAAVALLIPLMLLGIVTWRWFALVNVLFLLFGGALLILIISEAGQLRLRRALPASAWPMFLPALLLYVSVLPGVYFSAQGERPRKGLTCEREIRPQLEFPLTRPIITDERTESILEFFYAYQADAQIQHFDALHPIPPHPAYVIVNWERLFFLQRLYQTAIPEVLHNPPAAWNTLAVLGGAVNPCVIYEIP